MKKTPRGRARATAVSIASSDSGGGAGIQADLLTFAAHGVHGATVLVAATAQNTRGVAKVEPLSPRLIDAQIDAVFADLRPRAVKVGMLFDATRARAVARALRRKRAGCVVLDPVLVATTGRPLLDRNGVAALRRELLPLSDLVTPNRAEAEALSGVRIRSESDRRLAAGILADRGARAVLITGGDGRGREVRDLLFDGRFFTEIVAPRIRTPGAHGTGCTLSAAITANLALALPLEDAVVRGIRYVRDAIAGAFRAGGGLVILDHFPASRRRRRRSAHLM
jgi:hydroxymethylpyrimidine/phosphomethylpyrimidine kinase